MAPLEAKIMEIYTFRFCFSLKTSNAIVTSLQILHYRTWQACVESDGLPLALATTLRLAMDGLWFADLFGLASPSGKLREEVILTLLTMAGDRA